MTKIDRLLATHHRLLTDVKRQCDVIKDYDSETRPSVLVSRKSALEELWAEIQTNIHSIESFRDWNGTDDFNDNISTIRESYSDSLAHLMELLTADATATLQNSLLLGRNRTEHQNPNQTNNGIEHDGEKGNDTEDYQDATDDGQATNQTQNQILTSTPGRTLTMPINIKLPPLQIKVFSGNKLD